MQESKIENTPETRALRGDEKSPSQLRSKFEEMRKIEKRIREIQTNYTLERGTELLAALQDLKKCKSEILECPAGQ
jgi:hypothetical protein